MNTLTTLLSTLVLTLIFSGNLFAQDEIPSPEQQIHAAVSPAPESMQENARVLGYNDQGELVELREGSNELVCLADNPEDERFHVACYHRDLSEFMKRGRELRAEGKTGDEMKEIRRQEIENGDLPMPEKPTSLYSLTGQQDAWDYSANQLRSARPLYVVYIPYATVESTGLSPSPVSEGAPWLMDPGTPWAHIMVGTGRQMGAEAGNGSE